MSQEIAHGVVKVTVDDDDVARKLDGIDDAVKRKMKDIDRQSAEVNIKGDIKDLERDLARAKEDVKQFNKDIKAENDKANRAALAQQRKATRAEIAEMTARQKSARAQLKDVRQSNSELRLQEQRLNAIADAAKRKEKVLTDAAKARDREEAKAQVNHRREMQRNLREESAIERRLRQIRKEIAEVPKLDRAYAVLQDRLEKLQSMQRRTKGDRAKTMVGLDIADVEAQMKDLQSKVRSRAKRDPITLPIKFGFADRAGTNLRRRLGDNMGMGPAALLGVGAGIGRDMALGINRGFRNTLGRGTSGNLALIKGLGASLGGAGGRAALGGLNRIGALANSLSNMTVRLGPFTATIRQAIVAASLFAPILVDIAGAAGSLVGVVGSAGAGLGALGASMLSGVIPAFGGLFLAVKPVADEFKHATELSKAYHKALQEGNEDLAAKKLKALNHVLAGTDKATQDAFKSAGTLGQRWQQITEPSRVAAFKVIGTALKFADDNIGRFGRSTNAFAEAFGGGLQRLLKGLDTDAIFRSMRGVTAAIGPLTDGFANVLNYILQVGASASRYLKPLGDTFREWSSGLSVTDSQIDNVMDSLKAVGKFALSGGRLLKTFFGGGVEAGQDFLDVMTKAMDGWRRGMETATGQANLGNFFEEAVSGARAFWNFLQPIVASFGTWASLISPFARAFFEVTGTVGDFVKSIMDITVLQGPLTALMGTLGALFAVSRIAAATSAIGRFAAALAGLGKAQAVAGAASGVGSLLGGAGAAAGARGAASAAASAGASTAAAGAAAGVAAGRFAALRGAVMLAGRAFFPVVGTIAALAITMSMMTSKSEAQREEFFKLRDSAKETSEAYRDNANTVGELHDQQQRANLTLKQARTAMDESKKGTDEHRMAVLNYRDARRAAMRADDDYSKGRQQYKRLADQQVAQEYKALSLYDQRHTKERRQLEDIAKYNFNASRRAQAQARLDILDEKRQNLVNAVSRANDRAAATQANLARQLAGLPALSGNAERALGRLARTAGGKKLATTVGVKFTGAENAGKVAASASRALKAGVPQKVVTKIVVDSKNAEQAIRRLDGAKISGKQVKIVQSGGERAISMIEQIIGKRLTPKQQQIAERGGPAVLAMISRIVGNKIPNKTTTLSARDNASGGIARVNGMLGAMPSSKTVTLTTVNRVINVTSTQSSGKSGFGGARKADGGPSFAAGGFASMPDQRAQERASRTAALSGSRRTTGGKITNPQYLVGEEATPEWVISTNPRYRDRNRDYLLRAASALGMREMMGFAAGGSPFGKFGGKGNAKAEFNPTARITPSRKFKPTKKARNKLKATRSWAGYIEDLQTQQGIWEREVSIRESQVKEPGDFVIETGKQTVTDPTTGEKTEVPTYGPNPAIESQYKPQIAQVLDAMTTLMKIVAELVRAIPQAMLANAQEQKYRSGAIDTLDGEITKDKNRIKSTKGDTRDRHERALQKHREARDEHVDARKTLRDDYDTLGGDRINAGMSYREAAIARQEWQDTYDSAQGNAVADAAKQTADALPSASTGGAAGGAGAGGGADSSQLSIGQQFSAAAVEQMNVLKQFGSNFKPYEGADFRAAAMAATGGIINSPAGMSNPSGATGATGAALSSGAGAARSLMPTAGAAGAAGGASGGSTGGTVTKNVEIHQTFLQPPDPLTISAGIAFELNSAI